MPSVAPSYPVLIIWDGHGSHCSLAFLCSAKAAGVMIIWLPPHTSHKIQGEDVINFHLLKGNVTDVLVCCTREEHPSWTLC